MILDISFAKKEQLWRNAPRYLSRRKRIRAGEGAGSGGGCAAGCAGGRGRGDAQGQHAAAVRGQRGQLRVRATPHSPRRMRQRPEPLRRRYEPPQVWPSSLGCMCSRERIAHAARDDVVACIFRRMRRAERRCAAGIADAGRAAEAGQARWDHTRMDARLQQ